MVDEAEATRQNISMETEKMAKRKAKDRAIEARWNLEIALFLFAVLIMIIILATYTKVGLEIVAPVAVFGLAMVWLTGWRRGRQLYQRFYEEELSRLQQELKTTVKEAVEETIEEKVQKALRERLQ